MTIKLLLSVKRYHDFFKLQNKSEGRVRFLIF